jgi:hypothetical protein
MTDALMTDFVTSQNTNGHHTWVEGRLEGHIGGQV